MNSQDGAASCVNVTGTDRKIDARLTQPDSPDVHGWRSIETAPKDGTWILAVEMRVICAPYLKDPIPETLRWFEGEWDNGLCDETYRPSHWLPLPPLPVLP